MRRRRQLKKLAIILLFALLLALLPASGLAQEISPAGTAFHKTLGLTSQEQVQRCVLMFSNGKGIELSADELERFLELHWTFSTDRFTAPGDFSPERGGEYFNLYTDIGNFTISFAFSTVAIGTFGEGNYLYYMPYVGNAKNAIYTFCNGFLYDYKYLSGAKIDQPIPMAESPFPPPQTDFLQLPEDEWAVSEIQQAASKNILPFELANSYSQPITRGEFAELISFSLAQTDIWGASSHPESINNALDRLKERLVTGQVIEKKSHTDFNDVFTDTFEADIYYLTHLAVFGIVQGREDGRADPEGLLTRQEAAKILGAAVELFVEGNPPSIAYADGDLIADWARKGVDLTAEHGILQGVGDGRFDPHGTLTRQQAIAAANRLHELLVENRLPDALEPGF